MYKKYHNDIRMSKMHAANPIWCLKNLHSLNIIHKYLRTRSNKAVKGIDSQVSIRTVHGCSQVFNPVNEKEQQRAGATV